jgi:hypothetical protein
VRLIDCDLLGENASPLTQDVPCEPLPFAGAGREVQPEGPEWLFMELARLVGFHPLLWKGAMKVIWIVCWRGLEERCSSAEEAIDRWDELDARGIRAEVFELVDGARRKLRLQPAMLPTLTLAEIEDAIARDEALLAEYRRLVAEADIQKADSSQALALISFIEGRLARLHRERSALSSGEPMGDGRWVRGDQGSGP